MKRGRVYQPRGEPGETFAAPRRFGQMHLAACIQQFSVGHMGGADRRAGAAAQATVEMLVKLRRKRNPIGGE